MKYLFIFLLIPLFLFGQTTYTLEDSTHTTTSGVSDIGLGYLNRDYVAQKVTITGNYDIRKIGARVEKRNGESPVMDFIAHIFSHDATGDQPLTNLGTSTNTVNAATFPAFDSPDFVYFTFDAGITVAIDDTVWVALEALTTSSTNYCAWQYKSGDPPKAMYDADGVGNWTLVSNNVGQTRIYSGVDPSGDTEDKFDGFDKPSGWPGW